MTDNRVDGATPSADIVKLPYSVTRRTHARKRRRSKNGTPEERDAKNGGQSLTAQSAAIVKFQSRQERSDRTLADSANRSFELAEAIVWPEIPEPTDWSKHTDDELAEIDFAAIPEFCTDGTGAGTPEFREQLQAYFHVVCIACRHAIAVLGHSRSELAAISEQLANPNEEEDPAIQLARLLASGYENLIRLARYVRAAEVRQVCAIAMRGDKPAIAESAPPAA